MLRCLFAALLLMVFEWAAFADSVGEPLPDGWRATMDAGDIREAWYINPTDRYAHAVLGDAIEAGGLQVRLADGTTRSFTLDRARVFEDITPRLADLDGDGLNEVIAIQVHQFQGAALAILGMRDGVVQLIAENPFIGTPNRWLNPAGIADYDGDGIKEVAIITTPHIGGILSFWTLKDGALTRSTAMPGVSNHAIGSRALDLSATADVNGDGLLDLIVPDQARRALVAITLDQNRPVILGKHALAGRVEDNITLKGKMLLVPTTADVVEEVSLNAFK